MSIWQERLENERNELVDRLAKLSNFMLTVHFDDLPITEKFLLRTQREVMTKYLEILDARADLSRRTARPS